MGRGGREGGREWREEGERGEGETEGDLGRYAAINTHTHTLTHSYTHTHTLTHTHVHTHSLTHTHTHHLQSDSLLILLAS